ncbi:MAG TPA: SDR family oxidoreductase [Dictyobacter sp.]|jgi:3-oxoacyl-[acyl-carrier protein] reductase|nr:SDR family oxidoreductase [Dictyobacter sp.]
MDLGLKGTVAIVLAASKGLGRASAAALAAEGANVVIAARTRQELEQTAREIQQTTGSRALPVPVDVTKAEDLTQLVETTIQEFGRLDILVTNAGGPPFGTFDNLNDEQWQAAFELNLLSTVRIIRLALPHLRTSGRGRIINIQSMSVKEPIMGLLLSNSIRPGVAGLAKTLATEIGADHITINTVCPGRIMTDRILSRPDIKAKIEQGMSKEEATADQTHDIPVGRIGKPEELGALVTFLASAQAGYITGTSIPVDGGLIRSLL